MSIQRIQRYLAEIDQLVQYGGSRNEGSVRRAFEGLLTDYCQTNHLVLVPELEYRLPNGTLVKPDGTVKDALRLDWG